MKTNWIQKYQVKKDGEVTIITGSFSASAGNFRIEYEGDGGNADTHVITLSGCQYEQANGQPTTFTITGAWEIREVTEMFKLLDNLTI